MFKLVDSGVQVKLPKQLAKFLEGLPDLLESVGEQPGDPAATRLRPMAYVDDVDAQSDYEEFAGPQLASMRELDRQSFADTLADYRKGQVLTIQEAEAWVKVIGDARLALAARAGINDSSWETDTTGPVAPIIATLGYVQSSLVQALSAAL